MSPVFAVGMLVLVGGVNSAAQVAAWPQLSPSSSPSARSAAAMAFDPTSKKSSSLVARMAGPCLGGT
jgi:hypothetical protein